MRGIDINMNSMPDVVQTLAVMALFAKGETSISGSLICGLKKRTELERLNRSSPGWEPMLRQATTF